GDRIGGGKAEPDLVAAAPGHARAQRLVLLRNMQIDHVGDGDGFGEDDARALAGQVADQAAHGAAPLVEIDKAAQEAFQPSRVAAFAHRLPLKPSSKSKRKLTTAGLKPSYRRDLSRQFSARAGSAGPLPGRKQAAVVIDDGAERAGHQAGPDHSEHESRVDTGQRVLVDEMD